MPVSEKREVLPLWTPQTSNRHKEDLKNISTHKSKIYPLSSHILEEAGSRGMSTNTEKLNFKYRTPHEGFTDEFYWTHTKEVMLIHRTSRVF